MRYTAFISYSHAADGKLAPRLQSALQQFAKPWYRLHAIPIFRDKTSLSITPALWSSIEEALGQSKYFLLLASPESAASRWVQQEIDYWLKHSAANNLLIILTSGEVVWDGCAVDFIWNRTTALPRNLQRVFKEEPLFLDLRWARTEDHLSLRHPRFRDAIAEIGATLHGLPKDRLIGEEVRQHLKTKRLAWSAIIALLILVLVSSTTAYLAVQQRNEAERQRQVALSRQLGAQARLIMQQNDNLLQRSILLAIESIRRSPTSEAAQALQQGLISLARPVFRMSHNTGRDLAFVRGVAFSPDGRYLATASNDGTARIWEMTGGREVLRLEHGTGVNAITFSRDGKYVATASGSTGLAQALNQLGASKGHEPLQENTARVWELKSGREVVRMKHDLPVSIVAFSPDGKYLATANGYVPGMAASLSDSDGNNTTARIWEIASGLEIAHMSHDFPVATVAFSPDGKYVATASGPLSTDERSDNTKARIWVFATGREVARVDNGVIAFSPDGRYLATAAHTGARLWKTVAGQEVALIENTRQEYVLALAFSPDGRYLATGSMGGNIQLSRVSNGRLVMKSTHGGAVVAATFSPDGRYLATASSEGTARVWDLKSDKELFRMTHEESIYSIAFSPDGRYLATAGYGENAWVWEVRRNPDEVTPNQAPAYMGHEGAITDILYSPDGKYLATASNDKTVRVWEVNSGREVARMTHEAEVSKLAWSPDGQYIVTDPFKSAIQLWKSTTGQFVARLGQKDSASRGVAFSPDGKYVAFSNSNIIHVLEVTNGEIISSLRYQNGDKGVMGKLGKDTVFDVKFSPNGKYLAIGGADDTARVWEVNSGQEVARMQHKAWVNAIAWSPDGRYLATASGTVFRKDNAARIWEVSSGREVARLEHGSAVIGVAFSPDGRYLASASWDHTAQVWDISTGRGITSLKHDATVQAVAFSPDGKFLATAGSDHIARVWLWRQGDLIADACSRLTRNLTEEEWRFFIGDEPYRRTCPDIPRPVGHYTIDSELIETAKKGDAVAARALLDKGANTNARDNMDETALMYAAERGHIDIVQALLDEGADANARDNKYSTALMRAAFNGHNDIVRLLLDNGADVNARDAMRGMTALIVATNRGKPDTVQVLLDKGAGVNARDTLGKTALMIATEKGHRDIVQLLQKAGAKE